MTELLWKDFMPRLPLSLRRAVYSDSVNWTLVVRR